MILVYYNIRLVLGVFRVAFFFSFGLILVDVGEEILVLYLCEGFGSLKEKGGVRGRGRRGYFGH